MQDNQRNWDKYLARVTCAIRTSKHEATGMTPYFINYGREINLIRDGSPQVDDSLEFDRSQDEEGLMNIM